MADNITLLAIGQLLQFVKIPAHIAIILIIAERVMGSLEGVRGLENLEGLQSYVRCRSCGRKFPAGRTL